MSKQIVFDNSAYRLENQGIFIIQRVKARAIP